MVVSYALHVFAVMSARCALLEVDSNSRGLISLASSANTDEFGGCHVAGIASIACVEGGGVGVGLGTSLELH